MKMIKLVSDSDENDKTSDSDENDKTSDSDQDSETSDEIYIIIKKRY